MQKAITIISLIALIFFQSCNSENDDNSAAIIESKDSIKTKAIRSTNQDTITTLVNELGGYKKLQVTESSEKCNLFRGDFILNKIITDSATLAQLANHLAIYIHDNYNTKQNCPYVTMCVVHIYMNNKDFVNKEDVAFSEIIPSTPKGAADVTSSILAKYKSK